MKYEASITVGGEVDKIKKLFQAENRDFKHKRSTYSVKKKDDTVVFEIQAEDATALRSTFDSITKALKIYEDMKEIK